MTPTAFSPGSFTGFFLPEYGPTPAATVSRGLSFCLEHGVAAAARPTDSFRVVLNGTAIEIPPVVQVAAALAPEPVAVELETPLPLGCGFGVSAAAALATALAIDRRYDLGRPREQLGMAAHAAEVGHRTGIGDVAAQLAGGIVFRRGRTGPFDTHRLDHLGAPALFYRSFGPLSTRDVLRSPAFSAAIAAAGARAIAWLEPRLADVTLAELLDRSLEFAGETGLLTDPQVTDAIRRVRDAGGSATMVMLGQSVLATAAGDGEGWVGCRIDARGARLIP